MKKIAVLVAVLVSGLMFSRPVQAETITIVGTGSGSAILKAVGDVFSRENPGILVDVPKSIGSGGGIKAVGTEKNLIGRVARGIKEKENHYGLDYIPFVKMPIAFMVNKSVGIRELTPQQICDIYSGKVTDWADVGGKSGKIKVIRREDGDSSLGVLLKTFPGFADITLTAKSKTTYSDPKTCRFVESKADTIAFGTYANAKRHDVIVLDIAGKNPAGSDYPYIGTLAFVVKKKYKTGTVKKFVEFATSRDVHDAIKTTGGLPF